jgi:very-short-patch-repair endonuclease
MKKRKTQEEFERELSLVLPNIKVLGKYININTKIRFKCLIHDFEFDAFPQNMLRGHGCRKCGSEKQSKKQRKSHDKFVEDLKHINPYIEIVGKYINMDTKVPVRCLNDGYVWDADPRKLYKGCSCAVCSNRKVVEGINDIKTTRPDLVVYFKNKDQATQYTSGSDKIVDVVCPECGYEDKIRIGNLSRFGFACNGCYEKKYGRKRVPYGYWNKDTMAEYLNENYVGYKLLDVQEANTYGYLKVLIKCPNDNHSPYWAYWTNIISGYTCSLCYLEDSMSRGEHMAASIFKMHNINFEPQKRFDDCRDKYALPFDFYLPDYNLVVEIMGEQHEHPVDYFGGEESFKNRVYHDKMKRDYLKTNNINILDIWYYEFNKMEELILNKINSIINNTKLISK